MEILSPIKNMPFTLVNYQSGWARYSNCYFLTGSFAGFGRVFIRGWRKALLAVQEKLKISANF